MLPFGRLWYDGPNAVANAIGYAEHYSCSHDAVIRVHDTAGNVIETHEQTGDLPRLVLLRSSPIRRHLQVGLPQRTPDGHTAPVAQPRWPC